MKELFEKAALIAREEMALSDAKIKTALAEDYINKQIAYHEDRIKRLKERKDDLQAPAAAIAERIGQLKAEILEGMGDVTDADDGQLVLRVVYSGGKRAIEYDEVVDKRPAELPEQFHKTKIVADKDAIRQELERNELVGPEQQTRITFARLLPRGRTLKIEMSQRPKNSPEGSNERPARENNG